METIWPINYRVKHLNDKRKSNHLKVMQIDHSMQYLIVMKVIDS